MIFDNAAAMIEKWDPALIVVLEHANVYRMKVTPHELPKIVDDTKAIDLIDNFMVPPPGIMAIEDDASVVVIADSYRPQMGLTRRRLFIHAMPCDMSCKTSGFVGPALGPGMNINMPIGSMAIFIGEFSLRGYQAGNWSCEGVLRKSIIGTSEELHELNNLVNSPIFTEAALQDGVKGAMSAVEECAYAQSLPGFGGWPTGRGPGSIMRPTRVRRSNQRSVFEMRRDGSFEELWN